MCFVVLEDSFRQTAEEDIEVFKILMTNNRAPFYEFEYAPNCTYTLGARLTIDWSFSPSLATIREGFHSYKQLAVAWTNTSRLDHKVVRMFIPKGACYYRNDYEYVSDASRTGDLRDVRFYDPYAKETADQMAGTAT